MTLARTIQLRCWLVLLTTGLSVAAAPSFRNDVLPVISKAGCNLGTCHANATGKGGFQLSLREGDPEYDHAALALDQFGRRVNLLEPEQSLLLLKPTQQLAHEGGKRFDRDSWEYRVLRDWIAAGAPGVVANEPRVTELAMTPRERILTDPARQVQLKVSAKFSDGTVREVTSVAVYEPAQVGLVKVSATGLVEREEFGEATVLVRFRDRQVPVRLTFVPERRDFRWSRPPENNFVDRFIFAKLKLLRLNPSGLCSDEVFPRRAFLDLLGLPPTVREAKAFVADPDPGKRAALVDTLLARPEFADFWAVKWADLLKVEDRTLDAKGMRAFHSWIRASLAANKPMDQFAREIVSALGSTYDVPPANFHRANRQADLRAKDTAQVFLGTRLQCAQCHNHPFDRWTQQDYYDWAAVFGRIDYQIIENLRRDKNDKHEFRGEQIVFLNDQLKVTNPRTEETARARLLGAESRLSATNELAALGGWLASPGNPFFARAQVNRVWFHLMGRGLVDPVDDFRDTNPATHPELLAALTGGFAEHGFDLRRLIRTIMTSRAYQLDSAPHDGNAGDEINYSHTPVRRLGAEQLLDAQRQVTGVPLEIPGYPAGIRVAQLPLPVRQTYRDRGRTGAEKFLDLFGKPKRTLVCECERSPEINMSQAFALISGPELNEQLTHPRNELTRLLAAELPDEQRLAELYWAALTRAPTAAEVTASLAHLRSAKDARRGWEDLLWSLLNAKEFLFRR